MKRKATHIIVLAGIVFLLLGISRCNTVKAVTDKVVVTGTVYDINNQIITNRSVLVEANDNFENFEAGSPNRTYATIDENGQYRMELNPGEYSIMLKFHNRSLGNRYQITSDCVIDLQMIQDFYLVTGRMYLNGELYKNGNLQLYSADKNPTTGMDEAFIELHTDKNGEYDFFFQGNIYGAFNVYYEKNNAYFPAGTIEFSGKDCYNFDYNLTPETAVSLRTPVYQKTINGKFTPIEEEQPTNTPAVNNGGELISSPAPTPASTAVPKSMSQAETNSNIKIGKKIEKKGVIYQVSKNNKNTKEVTIIGCTRKLNSKITLPAYISYKKIKFSVTAISNRAFASNKKLSSVILGKNIRKIETKAFYKASALKKIVFQTKKMQKVGARAFVGINTNARIVVPKSCRKKYTKLLQGKY